METSDTELVRRSVLGDEGAFVELLRRYQTSLANLIRYQTRHPQQAEDLLQETFLHAWTHLRHLRQPHLVRAWLLQVARNRCRDFFKSAQRREQSVTAESLEQYLDRAGRSLGRPPEAAAELMDALEILPAPEQELVRLFYLEGLTVAEIAAQRHCPAGTVKRHLFHARDHLREAVGICATTRREEMRTRKQGTKQQPFPRRRPAIAITPSQAKPFAVDCREMRWWFGLPEVGDRTLWSTYDPPDWKISSATAMAAVQPAQVHGMDGVEVEVDEWHPASGWQLATWSQYVRLTAEEVQWLATSQLVGGKRKLYTFLDNGFEADWGTESRHLEDRGRFALQQDGSFCQQEPSPGALGAGMFSVGIGDQHFTCLRVFDVAAMPSEEGTLVEAYVTQEGRTVLFRRYNGRLWGKNHGRAPWDEAFPDQARLVVDGVLFVHWYDCLTGLACGL